MAEAAEKLATYEDLFEVPDNLVAEIIFGHLYTSPRPAPRHARASSSLGFEVGGVYDKGQGGPGGWWILDEPELHQGADILVPGLAGWRRERMPELPETAFFELAPDWICEFFHHLPHAWIEWKKCLCMPRTVYATCGRLILM